MAKVELKKPIVEEISENIKDAQSVVLVDYRGLTVEEDTKLRKELRNAGITYLRDQAQSLSLRMMQQHLQELSLSLLRTHRHLRLRPEL